MEMRSVEQKEYYIVDVFVEGEYAASKRAIFMNAHLYDEGERQRIAKDMDFLETVFVFPNESYGHAFKVKIFSEEKELAFAMHSALAAAYVVQKYMLKEKIDTIYLDLAIGRVPVYIDYEGEETAKFTIRQGLAAFGSALDKNVIFLEGKVVDLTKRVWE